MIWKNIRLCTKKCILISNLYSTLFCAPQPDKHEWEQKLPDKKDDVMDIVVRNAKSLSEHISHPALYRALTDFPNKKAHSFRGGMKVRLEQAWLYATSNGPTIFVYLLLFVGTTDTMWV
jgi:hypothetical protein